MYRFVSLLFMMSVIAPFVRTAKTYTLEECKIKCKKNYGTLRPQAYRSVEWTRPFIFPDGKCACNLNGDALKPMFQALGINYNDFLKWDGRGACFCRMWLYLHKIKVDRLKSSDLRKAAKELQDEKKCELEKNAKEKAAKEALATASGEGYTIKTCALKCNKEEGYIVVTPGNRLPITVPNLSKDKKKCTCDANVGPVYKFLKDNKLDADAFFRARNYGSACGRKWLLENNVQVDFELTLSQRFQDNGNLSQRFAKEDEGKDGVCPIDTFPAERPEWTRKARPFLKAESQQTTQGDAKSTNMGVPPDSKSVASTSKTPPAQPRKSEIEELGPG